MDQPVVVQQRGAGGRHEQLLLLARIALLDVLGRAGLPWPALAPGGLVRPQVRARDVAAVQPLLEVERRRNGSGCTYVTPLLSLKVTSEMTTLHMTM